MMLGPFGKCCQDRFRFRESALVPFASSQALRLQLQQRTPRSPGHGPGLPGRADEGGLETALRAGAFGAPELAACGAGAQASRRSDSERGSEKRPWQVTQLKIRIVASFMASG